MRARNARPSDLQLLDKYVCVCPSVGRTRTLQKRLNRSIAGDSRLAKKPCIRCGYKMAPLTGQVVFLGLGGSLSLLFSSLSPPLHLRSRSPPNDVPENKLTKFLGLNSTKENRVLLFTARFFTESCVRRRRRCELSLPSLQKLILYRRVSCGRIVENPVQQVYAQLAFSA